MGKSNLPDTSVVDRTPSVWFIRLEAAVRNKDVASALNAQRKLSELGFDVRVAKQAAVAS